MLKSFKGFQKPKKLAVASFSGLLASSLILGTAVPAFATEVSSPTLEESYSPEEEFEFAEIELLENRAQEPLIAESDSTIEASLLSSSTQYFPLDRGKYRVTSYYGGRCVVAHGAGLYHGALDMSMPNGSPIYASGNGVVTTITEAAGSTAGSIGIDYGTINGKRIYASYTHMWQASKYVKVGTKITPGQRIGDVGASGIANGPHLHLYTEVNGVHTDPLTVFKDYFGMDLVKGAASAASYVPAAEWCPGYNANTVGIKEKPDIYSKTLTVLPLNTKVELKSGPSTNSFVQVKLANGTVGYVHPLLFGPRADFANAPAIPNIKTMPKVAYTLTHNQNIRSHPSVDSMKSGVLVTLPAGAKVEGTGRGTVEGIYTEVTDGTYTGWISSTVIKELPPVVTPPDTKPPVITPPDTKPPVTKPPVTTPKPPVDKSPIKAGELVAKDSAGNLWNYGALAAGKKNARVKIGSGWKNFKSLTTGDFDANGTIDIVATHSNGKLYLYKGLKTGGFSSSVIGTSGWSNFEISLVKMKKTDKYPSLLTRDKKGVIRHYASNAGKNLKSARTIGSGWQGFKDVVYTDFDNDGKIDALAKNSKGQLLLYRTNGSGFINEKGPVVGSGWGAFTLYSDTNKQTSLGGVVAKNAKTGKLYYYPATGKRGWKAAKTIGNSGWGSYVITR